TRHRGIGIPQTRQKQQLQWLARAQRGYPATAVTAPGRYPATAVTAPGRYAARPAYAAAPLEKRGRPARAGLGARGPKPALRFAGSAPALFPGGVKAPLALSNVPNFAAPRADFAHGAMRRDPGDRKIC